MIRTSSSYENFTNLTASHSLIFENLCIICIQKKEYVLIRTSSLSHIVSFE